MYKLCGSKRKQKSWKTQYTCAFSLASIIFQPSQFEASKYSHKSDVTANGRFTKKKRKYMPHFNRRYKKILSCPQDIFYNGWTRKNRKLTKRNPCVATLINMIIIWSYPEYFSVSFLLLRRSSWYTWKLWLFIGLFANAKTTRHQIKTNDFVTENRKIFFSSERSKETGNEIAWQNVYNFLPLGLKIHTHVEPKNKTTLLTPFRMFCTEPYHRVESNCQSCVSELAGWAISCFESIRNTMFP